MIKDFYLKRWLLFFDGLKNDRDSKKAIAAFEKQWILQKTIPRLKSNPDITEDCFHLFQKYALSAN